MWIRDAGAIFRQILEHARGSKISVAGRRQSYLMIHKHRGARNQAIASVLVWPDEAYVLLSSHLCWRAIGTNNH